MSLRPESGGGTQTPTLFDVMYAAGLFEGEGSIHIHKTGGKKTYRSYSLAVAVNMCDREPLDWLRERWGGPEIKGTMSGRQREIFYWRLSARQAARFLRDIRPEIKSVRIRTKIDLGLAFQGQKLKKLGLKHSTLPKYRKRQEEFSLAMRSLNARASDALETAERVAVLDEITRTQTQIDRSVRRMSE